MNRAMRRRKAYPKKIVRQYKPVPTSQSRIMRKFSAYLPPLMKLSMPLKRTFNKTWTFGSGSYDQSLLEIPFLDLSFDLPLSYQLLRVQYNNVTLNKIRFNSGPIYLRAVMYDPDHARGITNYDGFTSGSVRKTSTVKYVFAPGLSTYDNAAPSMNDVNLMLKTHKCINRKPIRHTYYPKAASSPFSMWKNEKNVTIDHVGVLAFLQRFLPRSWNGVKAFIAPDETEIGRIPERTDGSIEVKQQVVFDYTYTIDVTFCKRATHNTNICPLKDE